MNLKEKAQNSMGNATNRYSELEAKSSNTLYDENIKPEILKLKEKGFPLKYSVGESMRMYNFLFHNNRVKFSEVLKLIERDFGDLKEND